MTTNVTNNVTCDVSDDLPDPPAGIEVDLHDFGSMPLDVERLRDSDLASLASAEEFRAAVLLWCAAWHQIPAGSIANDERTLARLAGYGRDIDAWRAVANGALRGFVLCSDQRLYHTVVVEKALAAFEKRKNQSRRTAAATKARLAKQRDVPRNEQRDEARNVHQGKGKGNGSTVGDKSPTGADAPFSDPKKRLYDLGTEVFGKSSGGYTTRLLTHCDGDIDVAYRTLEVASTKSDPREYVGAILRGDREPDSDWAAEYRRMGVSP